MFEWHGGALLACLQPLSRFYAPAPFGLFLASMPLLDLGYPAHESVMTSRLA